MDQRRHGNNDYPGKNMGMTVQQMQQMIADGRKLKGFEFDLVAGSSVEQDLNVPSTAKLLLGIAIRRVDGANPSGSGKFSLTLNNELIADKVDSAFLSNQFNDEEYYKISRPLSGNDNMTGRFDGVTDAGKVSLVMYYI